MKSKRDMIAIRDESNGETYELPATTRTISPESDNDWESNKVALDAEKNQTVYLSARTKKWERGVACVYQLHEWEPGERCYVEGEPTQRDKKGRQIFYLSTVLP